MTKNAKQEKIEPQILNPRTLDLCRPVLLSDKEKLEYDSLADQVFASVKPADAIEEIYTNDVVNLIWDSVRLRRAREHFLETRADHGVIAVLNNAGYRIKDPDSFAKKWNAHDPATRDEVEEIFRQKEIPFEAVVSETIITYISVIEPIGRAMAAADGRRSAALREIERHRATLALRLREVSERLETSADSQKAGASTASLALGRAA